jgi:hypothetical protein
MAPKNTKSFDISYGRYGSLQAVLLALLYASGERESMTTMFSTAYNDYNGQLGGMR